MPTVVVAQAGQIYPQPVAGVPVRAPLVAPQPGDVIIGYQLMSGQAGCCMCDTLSGTGWILVILLAFVFTPVMCIPCCIDSLHESYQVPVYGKSGAFPAGDPNMAAPQPNMMHHAPPPMAGYPAGYQAAPGVAPGVYPAQPAGGAYPGYPPTGTPGQYPPASAALPADGSRQAGIQMTAPYSNGTDGMAGSGKAADGKVATGYPASQ